ncbi:MAG: glycosyltransferase family 4 protein [Candidatus Kerfeldbacteria bacterium]|nr:glycosyltransferase family 4 protein [Candidatus Kerfeldbacteria bacterium]
MKIGIDARFFGGEHAKGLGRYTQKLIENLESVESEKHEFVIFLRKDNWELYQPSSRRFHKVLADFQWYSFEEQIKFPRVLNAEQCDLVHFPHYNVPLLYRRPFVVTIHDLILHHFPTVRASTLAPVKYWLKHAAYKLVIGSAVRNAKAVIAVSKFTKDDIVKTFRCDPEKVNVTYEAADPICNVPARDFELIVQRFRLPIPYALYVGNAYPHKNLEVLLDVARELKERGSRLHIVLVGRKEFFFERLQARVHERKLDDQIHFPGYVSDQDLPGLYHHAMMYVFPSLYEGFGLPPLEAMQCGIPVVSSNESCLPEIFEDSVLFVNSHDAKDIAAKMMQFEGSASSREEYVRRGREHVQKFSWKRMAEETYAHYCRVLS